MNSIQHAKQNRHDDSHDNYDVLIFRFMAEDCAKMCGVCEHREPFVSPNPSTAPTEDCADPTNHPTEIPTKLPSPTPSSAPTESPIAAPSESTVPTSTPTVTQCEHDNSSLPRFEPIASTGVEIGFNFTSPNPNDACGFTDGQDDTTEIYVAGVGGQIAGIDDFTILDNGLPVFGRPWGCDRATFGCGKTTLQISESYYDAQSTLEAEGNVYAQEDTNSVTVSWERVQGKEGDGDVNIQAKLFDNGDIQVCFGCGNLPTGATLAMSVDAVGAYGDAIAPTAFGPDTYPENQCFTVYAPKNVEHYVWNSSFSV